MYDDNRFNSYRRIEYDSNGNPYDPEVFGRRPREEGSLLITIIVFAIVLLLVLLLAGCRPQSNGRNILNNPLPPEPIPTSTEATTN